MLNDIWLSIGKENGKKKEENERFPVEGRIGNGEIQVFQFFSPISKKVRKNSKLPSTLYFSPLISTDHPLRSPSDPPGEFTGGKTVRTSFLFSVVSDEDLVIQKLY